MRAYLDWNQIPYDELSAPLASPDEQLEIGSHAFTLEGQTGERIVRLSVALAG